MTLQFLSFILLASLFFHSAQAMENTVLKKGLQSFYEKNKVPKKEHREWLYTTFKKIAEPAGMLLDTILNPTDTTPLLIEAAIAERISFIKEYYEAYKEIYMRFKGAKEFIKLPLRPTYEIVSIESFGNYTPYDIELMIKYLIKELEQTFKSVPSLENRIPISPFQFQPSSRSKKECCCCILQ